MDDKIEHRWWIKLEDKMLMPKYMECMNCHKQVKWWAWEGKVELENPLDGNTDNTIYCKNKKEPCWNCKMQPCICPVGNQPRKT